MSLHAFTIHIETTDQPITHSSHMITVDVLRGKQIEKTWSGFLLDPLLEKAMKYISKEEKKETRRGI